MNINGCMYGDETKRSFPLKNSMPMPIYPSEWTCNALYWYRLLSVFFFLPLTAPCWSSWLFPLIWCYFICFGISAVIDEAYTGEEPREGVPNAWQTLAAGARASELCVRYVLVFADQQMACFGFCRGQLSHSLGSMTWFCGGGLDKIFRINKTLFWYYVFLTLDSLN